MSALTSSPIFETAISLVVVWFLLAMAVSAVSETVASILKFRGKYLWTNLDLLFRTPTATDAVVGPKALATGAATPTLSDVVIADAPNAVPGGVVPLDLPVGFPPTADTYDNAKKVFTKVIALMPDVPTDAKALTKIKRINPSILVDSILAVQKTNPVEFEQTAIGKALAPFAGDGLDARRQSVERWVDDAMVRMSAMYRANMRKIGAIVALVVVIPLGVDTLWSAQHFYGSSTARAAALAVAGSASADSGKVADCLTNAVPIDKEATATTKAPNAGGATPKTCTDEATDDLGRLGVQRYYFGQRWVSEPDGRRQWLAMFAGLAVSVGAASMGAPFWFDVLKRAMGLRKQQSAPARS